MWMEGLSDAFRLRWKLIRATPPEDRSLFAKQIWQRRHERGTDHGVPF